MVLSRFKRKSYSIVALFLLIVGLPTLAFAGAKRPLRRAFASRARGKGPQRRATIWLGVT